MGHVGYLHTDCHQAVGSRARLIIIIIIIIIPSSHSINAVDVNNSKQADTFTLPTCSSDCASDVSNKQANSFNLPTCSSDCVSFQWFFLHICCSIATATNLPELMLDRLKYSSRLGGKQ
jgi:uncharacterized membrane protein YwzB